MRFTVEMSEAAANTIDRLALEGETPAGTADRLISLLARHTRESLAAEFGEQRPVLGDAVRSELKQGAIVRITGHGPAFVGIVTNRTWREHVLQVRVVGVRGLGLGYGEWSGYYRASNVEFVEQARGGYISRRQDALQEYFSLHPEERHKPESGQPDKPHEKGENPAAAR